MQHSSQSSHPLASVQRNPLHLSTASSYRKHSFSQNCFLNIAHNAPPKFLFPCNRLRIPPWFFLQGLWHYVAVYTTFIYHGFEFDNLENLLVFTMTFLEEESTCAFVGKMEKMVIRINNPPMLYQK